MAGDRRLALHAGVVLVVFVTAYWSAVGGGFLSDDFRWILESRVRDWADLKRPFTDTTGFFRPLVALEFAALERLAGNDPGPYGLALFFVALGCACAIAVFARTFGLRWGACLFAGSIWLLNPHGINMSILWTSGLTALSLVFFGVCAGIAVRSGRAGLAIPLFFAALLSKEEAVLLSLPLLFIAWSSGMPRRQLLTLLIGLVAVEGLYFYLRSGSDAATPATAVSFYRFTFDPRDVAANIGQYADRALTLSAVALLGIFAAVRRRPTLLANERQAIVAGLVWLVFGFGITVFLPVRSSLYVLMPAAGGILAVSAIVGALWRQATGRQRTVLAGAALVLPLCLLPVLRSRAERWTDLMRVTRTTLEAVLPALGTEDAVVFVDDRSRRDNLENGFRALFPDALQLYSGRRPTVWMVPPPSDATPDMFVPLPSGITLGWQYRDGRVDRIDPGQFAGIAAVPLR